MRGWRGKGELLLESLESGCTGYIGPIIAIGIIVVIARLGILIVISIQIVKLA